MNADGQFFVKIVIPNFNSEKTIMRLLESIEGQTCSSWFVQVFDDHSEDNSPDMIQDFVNKFPTQSELIRMPSKLYAGGIRNESIRHKVNSQFTWFIDNDDHITDDTIIEQLKTHCTNEDIDIYTLDCVQFKYDRLRHHAPWLRIVRTEKVSPTFMEGPDSVWVEDVPQFYHQFNDIPDERICHLSIPAIWYSGSHNPQWRAVERLYLSYKLIPTQLDKQWLRDKYHKMTTYLRSQGKSC